MKPGEGSSGAGTLEVPRVAVIGGGLAGGAFALHLMRRALPLPIVVEIIEPRPLLGAGLAYSTPDPEHRINVAAARMVVLEDDPTHFDRWLRSSGELDRDPAALTAGDRAYPQRLVFGRYMDRLIRETAERNAAVDFRHVRNRVRAIRPAGGGYRLLLDSGLSRWADLLVLAVGHPSPALPAPLRELSHTPAIVADPWAADALHGIGPGDAVLIVGTGLTMSDCVASLRARGHHGLITALSRRGLLPRPRSPLTVSPFGDFLDPPAHRMSQLLHRVRRAARLAARDGRPWQDAIDALRAQATPLWRGLSLTERRRFLRHLRPYWDVHRYQAAPQIGDLLAVEQQSGRLRVLAASLRKVEPSGGGFDVAMHRRGTPAQEILVERFAAIVNCTGPGFGGLVRSNPALVSLQEAGLLRPDSLGLGIDVDEMSRVMDERGRPSDSLFAAGPLARGSFGELMGLPQVASQPGTIAEQALAWLHARRDARLRHTGTA